MADQSLLDFFSGPALTRLMDSELIKPGIKFFMDEAFRKPSTRKPIGTQFDYVEFKGVRSTGFINNYNSPPVSVEVNGADKKFGSCIGGRESFEVPDELYQAVKSNIPYVAANAFAEYQRRLRSFRTRAETRRINAIASAILTGAIYYKPSNDGRGQVTNSATSGAINVLTNYTPTSLAVTSVIPNNGTDAIADWSTASTDIPSQLRKIKSGFLKASNYVAAVCHYGANIPSYLGVTNTAMQAYWSRNQRIGEQFMDTNEVPAGFADLVWKPAYNQYYLDETGASVAVNSWIDPDTIVITPTVSEDWYEFVEGSAKVPVGIPSLLAAGDIESLMNQLTYQWGISAYSQMAPVAPFTLSTITQDYMLPVPKNGLAHWIIKVKA